MFNGEHGMIKVVKGSIIVMKGISKSYLYALHGVILCRSMFFFCFEDYFMQDYNNVYKVKSTKQEMLNLVVSMH